MWHFVPRRLSLREGDWDGMTSFCPQGAFPLSSCMSHMAVESSATEPDWCPAARAVGTNSSSVAIPRPTWGIEGESEGGRV